MKQLILISFTFMFFSCHLLIQDDRPYRSININEQLGSDASVGLFKELLDVNNTDEIVLSASPPSSLLRPEGFDEFSKNLTFLTNLRAKFKLRKLHIFCTYSPTSSSVKLQETLKLCEESKVIGVKFYQGHSIINKQDFKASTFFKDENSKKILQYLNSNELIAHFLVNSKEARDSMLELIDQYPRIKFICSNMCFLSNNIKKLNLIMQKYPKLLIDYSFISPVIFEELLKQAKAESSVSKNIKRDVRYFFKTYSDRILYASSYLIDQNNLISKEYITWFSRMQLEFLAKEIFTFYVPPIKASAINYIGLNLNKEVIDKIYYSNSKKLLNSLNLKSL